MQMEQTLIEQYKTIERGYNNSPGGQYAAKGYLTGEARLVLHGLRSTSIQEFHEWASLFSHADKSLADADKLNALAHHAVALLQSGTLPDKLSPAYADTVYLAHLIHVMVWLSQVVYARMEGDSTPEYTSYADTVENAIFT